MPARRRQRFVRPAPRTKIWIGAGVGRTTIVGGAKTLVSSLNAAALLLRPFTILRTRMLISWTTDQEAADEGPFGVYGEIVVTEQAAAIGVTAIPDPSDQVDPDADWFVYQPVWTQFVTTAGGGISLSSPNNWTVDSKAMRKVGPDDQQLGMFSEDSGVGGFLTTYGRFLLQLH